jgi:hypothetical protein
MPNKPSDKPTCYEAQHLPGHLFKTWNVMFRFTGQGARPFTAAIWPTLCNMLNQTEASVTASVKKLCAFGWLVRHGGGKNPLTGRNRPYHYDVLSHDEFVKQHPGSCPPLRFPMTEEDRAARPAMSLDEILANNLLRSLPLPPGTILPNPFGKVIVEAMSQLTVPQRFETVSRWYALSGLQPPDDLLERMKQEGESYRLWSTGDGDGPALPRTDRPRSTEDRPSPVHDENGPRYTEDGPSPVGDEDRPRSTGEELDFNNIQQPQLQPHGADPVVVVVVDEKTVGDVDLLIQWFVEKESSRPKGVSKKIKADIRGLSRTHSRAKLLAAGKAWLKASPWNEKTECH